MRPISEVIVHTTATRPEWMAGHPTASKVAEVRRWHVKDRGWRDIGYHFLIDRDGTVAPGRPLDQVGAHVAGRNTGTIGVSLFGGHGSAETDAFADHYTPEQDKALRKLLADLQVRFGPLTISGHNQYAAKACPGFNVPKWLARNSVPARPDDAADTPADPVEVARWRIAAMGAAGRAIDAASAAALAELPNPQK